MPLQMTDPNAERRTATIEMLEKALEEAQKGEVIGVAMVLLEAGGTTTHHMATRFDNTIMAGAIFFLLARMSNEGWE